MKKDEEHEQKGNIFLIVLAAVLFLIAGVSFWFYREIYNENNFQNHVNSGLQTQKSRDAVAFLIIDQAFKDKPVLKSLVADQAQQALSGVLFGPKTENIRKRLILRVYDVLFSSQPRAIAIDLGGIKSFVSNLSQLVETATGTNRERVNIPDQIVIVKGGDIPSIAALGLTILWVGPIALITSLILFVWQMWKSRAKSYVLAVAGVALSAGSLIIWLLSAWYKPIALAFFHNGDVRVVAEQVLNEFLKPLNTQNLLLFILGICMIAGGLIYRRVYLKSR